MRLVCTRDALHIYMRKNMIDRIPVEQSGKHQNIVQHDTSPHIEVLVYLPYSKVRSLTLDGWEPENVKVMMEPGNDTINRIYEARKAENSDIQEVCENCDISVREAFIKAKYVEKRFVCRISKPGSEDEKDIDEEAGSRKWVVKKFRRRTRRTSSSKSDDEETLSLNTNAISLNISRENLLIVEEDLNSSSYENECILGSDQESTEGEDNYCEEEDLGDLGPDLLLYRASAGHNLAVMCMAFALGAKKLWRNEKDLNRTPLHQAVLSGSTMACEYLLLNGVPIDPVDDLGYSALQLATTKGCIAQSYLLLKHRARHDIVAKDGKQPLDIAVDQRNADIVTLLRLTRLNEEIGRSEEATGEDETYKDVMKDFSHFASRQPRLLRNRNDNNNV